MLRLRTIALPLIAVAALGTNLFQAPAQAEQELPLSRDQDPKRRLARADNSLGFKLIEQLRKGAADKNIFISPLSIAIALQMTYNGAGGDTATEMASAMQLSSDMDRDYVNKANKDLKTYLTTNDKLAMKIANAIFARKGVAWGADFLKRNVDSFGAQVEALDFASSATAEHINKWCADNTNNKITKIVDRINADDMMFLINAVYFKGNWKYQFKKESTKDAEFTLADGKTVTAPLMNHRMDITGLMGEDFMAGKLMYEDDRTSMVIFIPDKADGLADFMTRLSAEQWAKWMTGFGKKDNTRIVLPRFKLEYEAGLVPALKALGMKKAFTGGADFGAMLDAGKKDLFITDVLHKTYVDVNEEGTEAAAVTSVRVGKSSVERRSYALVADKPFFYAICDETTGAILFMGTMNNPVAK